MSDFAVIIPTDGKSGSMLARLVLDSPAPVILIWTAPPLTLPDWLPAHCDIIYDSELPKNIGRWWNRGLTWARNTLDVDVAVFCNDDIEVGDGDLANMADLRGHTLSMIAGNWQSGWCFGLDLTSELHFDEQYTWWYHETDIRERAEEMDGIRWVEHTRICHRKFRQTEYGELREQVLADIALWDSRHPKESPSHLTE